MKKIIILISLSLLSCKKENKYPDACPGGCSSSWEVIYKNKIIHPNSNNYYEIKYNGLEYFQVKGVLSELDPQYVVNDVPLIESNFNSDYWVVFDTIVFTSPLYSPFGVYSDASFNSPIPIGTQTYTLKQMGDAHYFPFNIVGYQLTPNMCYNCSYSSDLIKVYSKYTYNPKCNILITDEMIGDTAHIYIQTIFNSDSGESETVNKTIKVIFI